MGEMLLREGAPSFRQAGKGEGKMLRIGFASGDSEKGAVAG